MPTMTNVTYAITERDTGELDRRDWHLRSQGARPTPSWATGSACHIGARVIAPKRPRKCCAMHFEDLGLHRMLARHFKRNPASGRVMQKIGMTQEGCMREHFLKWGQYEDIVFYGIASGRLGCSSGTLREAIRRAGAVMSEPRPLPEYDPPPGLVALGTQVEVELISRDGDDRAAHLRHRPRAGCRLRRGLPRDHDAACARNRRPVGRRGGPLPHGRRHQGAGVYRSSGANVTRSRTRRPSATPRPARPCSAPRPTKPSSWR